MNFYWAAKVNKVKRRGGREGVKESAKIFTTEAQ
jgi:hypothetical protein